MQLVDQFDGFIGVVLGSEWNDGGVSLVFRRADAAILPGLDGVTVDVVDLAEEGFAAVGSGIEQGEGSGQLVVDDVAESPLAAEPGTRVFGAGSDVAWRGQGIVRVLEGAAALGFEVGTGIGDLCTAP